MKQKTFTDELFDSVKTLSIITLFGVSCGVPSAIHQALSPCYQQKKRLEVHIPIASSDGRQYIDVIKDIDAKGTIDMVERYEVIYGTRNNFPSEVWTKPRVIKTPTPPAIKMHIMEKEFFDQYEMLR